jgi:hypothetical protein
MLDTLRRVPTPEGIELTLRLAGPAHATADEDSRTMVINPDSVT